MRQASLPRVPAGSAKVERGCAKHPFRASRPAPRSGVGTRQASMRLQEHRAQCAIVFFNKVLVDLRMTQRLSGVVGQQVLL